MIEPITLRGGKTLFPTDGQLRTFELVSSQVFVPFSRRSSS